MRFGTSSLKRLWTCHTSLQTLMNKAIKKPPFDFCIVCGHRGRREQKSCVSRGTSGLKYPQSKHNKKPSLAVDIAPYPIVWENEGQFIQLGKYVKKIAETMGIDVVWGGDWSQEKNGTNRDLPHFELK
jgi:peptidoglycan L-alanyl-D-glutamate endopeptidase CwlK